MNYTKSKIGDICTMVKGTYPTMKTPPGEYPFVVTAAYRRAASTYQIDGEAVCIPLVSSTGHGDAAIHRVHYQDGKFALANLLVALIPKDKNICSAKYLYHLLMVKKDEYLVPLMRGTANVSLKEQDIAQVEIPLPPLKEQRRIVVRVEELVGKVEEVRSLRQQARKEVEALMGVEEVKIWTDKSLKNAPILQDVTTYLSRGRQSKQGESNHYLIKTQHVQMGKYVKPQITLAPDIAAKVSSEAIVRHGDILIACSAAGCLGRVAYYIDSGIVASTDTHIAIARANRELILPEYLYAYLKSFQGQVQLRSR